MMDELDKLLSKPLGTINDNGFCEKNALKVVLYLRRRQLLTDIFTMLMVMVGVGWLYKVDAFYVIKSTLMQWYQQLTQNSVLTLPSTVDYAQINLPAAFYQPTLLLVLLTMAFVLVITAEKN